MLTQEIVDKLSDEFKSTFMLVSPTSIANCLYPHEKEQVNRLLKKHLPSVIKINYSPQAMIAPDYYIYTITITGV